MPDLQTLYQLQIAALEQADTARKLQEAQRGLGESVALRRARETLECEETGLARLRARVRDLELEVKSLTSKIAAHEQRMYSGEVRNPKELASLQDDLASLRSRRDRLEDSILAGLDEADGREDRLERARSEWEAVHAAWQEEQGRLAAAVTTLSEQLARIGGRVAELRAAISAPLLEQYDDLCRKKGGRGVAAIRSGMCEGCRVQVPTRIAQQVRRGTDTICCDSCGRILCPE
jgi:predicted  nucleic acid-binding Zn-ribbon protein